MNEDNAVFQGGERQWLKGTCFLGRKYACVQNLGRGLSPVAGSKKYDGFFFF